MHNEHDITKLTGSAQQLIKLFDNLGRVGVVEEFIPWWKQPGWTTPAEFVLVDLSLRNMVSTAKGLVTMRDALGKGIQLVGKG